MGQALVARSQVAKSLFEEASEILGFDLQTLCFAGPEAELNRTEFSQPALFVHSYAAWQQLRDEQPELQDALTACAGLSLGEYTAVAAAGSISFADGVRLVQVRGKAMQAAADAVASGMSSILGLAQDQLADVCSRASEGEEFVTVANLLCPGNIAISGHLAAIERAEAFSTESGAMKAVRLQVAGAFHTEIMRPAVARLEEALGAVEMREAQIPVYSNVDAQPHRSAQEIKALLARQVVSPVLWEASLRAILETGVEKCIEVGTGRVLAGTLKRIERKFPCENYGNA